MTFIEVWMGYATFGVLVFSVAFIWAVRTRQFTNLRRAGHIPLEAEETIKETKLSEGRPKRIDRYTWVILLLISTGLLGTSLWMGLLSRK